ncbi:MAG: DUF4276 family protein [Chloroflexota bacterium]|nr:DUF4276 family protein [Chloroflexota bacterium]MDE2959288.1 DUF4276 family protein [Chloroflexota bacterium]
MTRLFVLVEGETEETFVNDLLAPHLYRASYLDVSARLMGGQRQKSRRGGIRPWSEARRGIENQLRQDAGLVVTTMVDYYGLPTRAPGAWPGRAEANRLPFPQRAAHVENAIRTDVATLMGNSFNPVRFVPYVMMHEFEAMLFSDCEKFAQAIYHPELADRFQEIRDGFNTPEEINDSPETAPSKRIEMLAPDYQKPVDGTAAASEIGLTVIGQE